MRLAILSALAFVGTVFAANWALQTYGFVPVGFGLEAPAGVYFVGLAFLLRDTTQRFGGRHLVVVAILVGAACSYFVSPTFAFASGAAFLISELADFAVYTPLARRSFVGGVVASNVVGTVVDSALFLWLAFGSLAFIEGQIVGKMWVTAAALPFLLFARKALPDGAGEGA
jgi:uncharacterized PurR-regulated membrane protein YhhQ (DUF165 family)